MRFRPIFLVVSLLLISISTFSIIKWNFRQSIDFAGGSVWGFNSELSKEEIEKIFNNSGTEIVSISQSQDKYLIKFKSVTQEEKQKIESAVKENSKKYVENRFETLGPSLGRELLQKTIVAIILSSVFLLLFIGSRFNDFSFGAAAVFAMFHDAFILIGSFSLLGHFFGAELDSLFVTALLTTLSASVHDTVVTFDRIRELRRKSFKLSWVELADQAVSEVIVRSINNSMTIIIMLLSLVILGGETTRWFAAALLIGVVCGTYSSIGVAIPSVLFLKNRQKKH